MTKLCLISVMRAWYCAKTGSQSQLELVFVKHYVPNICLSPNMAEFAVS